MTNDHESELDNVLLIEPTAAYHNYGGTFNRKSDN